MQFGCGWSAPSEWINFDASPTLRFERLPLVGLAYTKNAARFPKNVRYGDIVRGLPVPPNSCRGVYASHVLEHLTREDFEKALAEVYRILAVGGLFRVVVPDLEKAARSYVAELESGATDANDVFMRRTSLGREAGDRSIFHKLQSLLGNRHHMWMWDTVGLAHRLSSHGFKVVRRCEFNDCVDRMFCLVEEEHRFRDAVAFEAEKS